MTINIPSFFEIGECLLNENAAINSVISHGILEEPVCEACGSQAQLRIGRKVFRCQKFGCRKEWSCLRRSFFAKTKLPVHKVLFLSYYWLARASRNTVCA